MDLNLVFYPLKALKRLIRIQFQRLHFGPRAFGSLRSSALALCKQRLPATPFFSHFGPHFSPHAFGPLRSSSLPLCIQHLPARRTPVLNFFALLALLFIFYTLVVIQTIFFDVYGSKSRFLST
jgi:hypothetical protein